MNSRRDAADATDAKDATDLVRLLFRAALAAVDPALAVRSALADADVARALRRARRVGVFAAGKAAAGMFRAAWERGQDGLIVLPKGDPEPPLRSGVSVLFASHPEPDPSSVRAARAAVEFFSRFGPEDVVLCLVSGGSSSLLCLPRPGITLAGKRRAVRRLVREGAPIGQVNRLRTSLSAIKGGKLARRTSARIVTLVISDVPSDRPDLVGSGPTIRKRHARDLTRVVARNGDGLAAAESEARRLGLVPRRKFHRLRGEARDEGARFGYATARLHIGEVLFAGGETTVTLERKAGRGGRNLELALAAAGELDGRPGVAVLAAGSDGKDGSSDAAGAVVDGTTLPHARSRGLDPERAIRSHDTEAFFERAGGLVQTGPTGTNVADWAFGVRVLKP